MFGERRQASAADKSSDSPCCCCASFGVVSVEFAFIVRSGRCRESALKRGGLVGLATYSMS